MNFVFFALVVVSELLLNGFISERNFIPQSTFLIERSGYLLSFDGRTRNANWVYERLTEKNLENRRGERKKHRFKLDLLLPKALRVQSEEYTHTGFDRGHLCPFGDLHDTKAAEESFYMSNISPQVPQFNQGYWKKLEEHVRDLISLYDVLHVITIPLYLPIETEEGRFVCYRVLGKNSFAVPTHFCKVIFAERLNSVEVFVYLLPNASIEEGKLLDEFKTTLEEVERCSGIIFNLYSFRLKGTQKD